MSATLLPGRAYSFRYPCHNYKGLPSTTELRRLIVIRVRDVAAEPLDPTTVPMNPQLTRGRWLVTGQDLDKGEERSFYRESMSEIAELPRKLRYKSAEKISVFIVGDLKFGTLDEAEAAAKRLSELDGQIVPILVSRAALKRLRVAKLVSRSLKAS